MLKPMILKPVVLKLLSSPKFAFTAIVTSLLVACSTTPPPSPPPQPAPPPVIIVKPAPTPPVLPTPPVPAYGSFADWKNDFIKRATANGFNRFEVERLILPANYDEQIVSLDRSQPEFAKMPWEYVDGASSSARVNGGQRNYNAQRSLLLDIESRYGVPASIITAIWGMESSYGQGTGNTSLVDSLATLAYDGRRRAFAEEQLLALLQLLQRGDIDWTQLKGSWAGGMGHTQFIPKTWLVEGVDGNSDGHKNPWNSTDALTSTASYLSNAGWHRGLAPFYEVRLPTGFDYRLVSSKKPISEWQQLGITSLSGLLSGNDLAELWLPTGKEGPALLLTKNFDAIKVYNNSANYALGVSLLAKAIVGQSGLQTDFPRYERPLARFQVIQLQQRLTSLGFDTKGSDGVIGNNTKLAFQRWQAATGQIPDGFITQRSAAMLIH